MFYIDVLVVSPATLLLLYEASFDTAPPPVVSPIDPVYPTMSPFLLALFPLLPVYGETSCCFILDRGHSHFIQVASHTLLHIAHPLAPSSSSCRAPCFIKLVDPMSSPYVPSQDLRDLSYNRATTDPSGF